MGTAVPRTEKIQGAAPHPPLTPTPLLGLGIFSLSMLFVASATVPVAVPFARLPPTEDTAEPRNALPYTTRPEGAV
jgi:hypothetical protein